jgi:hydroxyethylthiazole kinase-like uncharacterized protein yjeF
VKPRRARTLRSIEVDRKLLVAWPLPMPGSAGDKEDRGQLLIVAGSADVPGAAILAANAALRAGVGKLTIATEETVAVAQSVPEARVLRFDQEGPGIRRSTHHAPDAFDAILVGPGLEASAAVVRCAKGALATYPAAMVVLDAGALTADVAAALPSRRTHGMVRCILTPHAGEMASLLGITKHAVEAAPEATALDFAARHDVALVLKGATTWIAMRGRLWRHAASNVGLATSGSGDALAGIIAALAARGAAAEQAAAWGVALHAMAGARLVRRHGALGILAREIPREIPAIMNAISRKAAA